MQIESKADERSKAEAVRKANAGHTIWLGTYILLALVCLGIYFALRLRVFDNWANYRLFLQRSALGGFFIFIVLTASRYAQALISRYNHAKAIAYNLIRLVRIISALVICMIIIAFLFVNW